MKKLVIFFTIGCSTAYYRWHRPPCIVGQPNSKMISCRPWTIPSIPNTRRTISNRRCVLAGLGIDAFAGLFFLVLSGNLSSHLCPKTAKGDPRSNLCRSLLIFSARWTTLIFLRHLITPKIQSNKMWLMPGTHFMESFNKYREDCSSLNPTTLKDSTSLYLVRCVSRIRVLESPLRYTNGIWFINFSAKSLPLLPPIYIMIQVRALLRLGPVSYFCNTGFCCLLHDFPFGNTDVNGRDKKQTKPPGIYKLVVVIEAGTRS